MFKSHDGEIHIIRLASFYKSLIQGNIFPRWGGNLNNGLGHPTLMFLYPLPYYFGSLLHFIGFSFTNSVKILFALSYVLSGFFMYLLLKKWFHVFPAIVGCLIYIFAPYRFVDFYVRGALPENMFFMFAPISLWVTIIYINKPTYLKLIFSSIFLAACILTHNASAFFFYPFAFLLLTVKNWSSTSFVKNIKFITKIFLPFVFGLVLSFYYWFPAIIEGKYTLRNLIVNKQAAVLNLSKWWQLIIPSWGYGDPKFTQGLSVQIGIINLLVVLLIIYLLINKKIKFNLLLKFLMICQVLAAFLITTWSKQIWIILPVIFNILYPWRLLVLICIISPLFGAILTEKIFKKKHYLLFTFVFGTAALFLTFDYQKPSGFFSLNEANFNNNYSGTADLGESSPIWSTLSTDNKSYPPVAVLSGNASIQTENRVFEYHSYQIDVLSEKARIIDYTLYFPGWDLYDNQQKITDQIEFQDPEFRGLMTFRLPYGKHQVILQFNNTRVRNISEIISLSGIVLLSAVFLLNRIFVNKLNIYKIFTKK